MFLEGKSPRPSDGKGRESSDGDVEGKSQVDDGTAASDEVEGKVSFEIDETAQQEENEVTTA